MRVASAGTTIDYAYNARHQRVRKSLNGKNTYFQYDDSGILLVVQDALGKVVSEYIYLGMQPVGQIGGQLTAASSIQLVGTSRYSSTVVMA